MRERLGEHTCQTGDLRAACPRTSVAFPATCGTATLTLSGHALGPAWEHIHHSWPEAVLSTRRLSSCRLPCKQQTSVLHASSWSERLLCRYSLQYRTTRNKPLEGSRGLRGPDMVEIIKIHMTRMNKVSHSSPARTLQSNIHDHVDSAGIPPVLLGLQNFGQLYARRSQSSQLCQRYSHDERLTRSIIVTQQLPTLVERHRGIRRPNMCKNVHNVTGIQRLSYIFNNARATIRICRYLVRRLRLACSTCCGPQPLKADDGSDHGSDHVDTGPTLMLTVVRVVWDATTHNSPCYQRLSGLNG